MGWKTLSDYDDVLRNQYGPYICGVDESGRGSWAGAIYAASVVLKQDAELPGLNDSKKMNEESRAVLFELIKENSLAYSIKSLPPEEIDKSGLNPCNFRVMHESSLQVNEILENKNKKVSLYVIDQSPLFKLQPYLMMPKADGTSLCVAAASVLAKHSRDEAMKKLATEYPAYSLETHKGYVNDVHKSAVLAHGLVKGLHRYSYKIKGVTAPHQCNISELFD